MSRLLVFCIYCLLSCLIYCDETYALPNEIGIKEILIRAESQFSANQLGRLNQDKIISDVASKTSFANPQIQYGRGQVNYGGVNPGDFEQFAVSQNIQLNGQKNSISKQGDLRLNIANIESSQFITQVQAQAIIAAYLLLTNIERATHVQERLDNLKIVRRFLKTRQFTSEKSKIEAQLIENKIDEISLEVIDSQEELILAKERLAFLIGNFSAPAVKLPWLSEEKIHNKIITIKGFSRQIEEKRQAQVNLAKEQRNALRYTWVPDLQFYYNSSKEKFTGGNKNQTIGIGFEIPIFNAGVNDRKKATSELQITELKQTKESIELKTSLRQIMKKFKLSIETLKIFNPKSISAKDQVLDRAVTSFKKGLISASLFLDLEDQDHEIHQKVLNARFLAHQSYLQALIISGHKIDFAKELK